MNIIQDHIPVRRNNRPGTKMIGPQYITIHETENLNTGANAAMHAKYLKGNVAANRPASWHFTVDDQQAIQHLPLDEIGWHAGDGHGPGNMSSIGIEICENADGNRMKTESNAAKLTAQLIEEFGFPLTSIVQHNRWSGKNCPGTIRSRPNGWEKFIEEVKGHMTEKRNVFKDVPDGHWAAASIKKAAESGVIVGVSKDEFGVGQAITREQLAVILDRLGLLEKGGD